MAQSFSAEYKTSKNKLSNKIIEAIERGITYFDNNEQTNRFLFIVSDGEDHIENTVSLAKEATQQGIKIYTVGVGTEKGAPIPIRNNGISRRNLELYFFRKLIPK